MNKIALTIAMNQFLYLEDEDPEQIYQLLKDNYKGYVIARYALNDQTIASVRYLGQRSEATIEELLRRIDELAEDIERALETAYKTGFKDGTDQVIDAMIEVGATLIPEAA